MKKTKSVINFGWDSKSTEIAESIISTNKNYKKLFIKLKKVTDEVSNNREVVGKINY